MTREQVKELEKSIVPFVDNLKKTYNAKVKVRIAYGTSEFKITISAEQAPEGTDPATEVYRQNAIKWGDLLGVTENMLGKKNKKGETLIGIAPNRSKYPIVIQKPDGKIVLTTENWLIPFKLYAAIKSL